MHFSHSRSTVIISTAVAIYTGYIDSLVILIFSHHRSIAIISNATMIHSGYIDTHNTDIFSCSRSPNNKYCSNEYILDTSIDWIY